MERCHTVKTLSRPVRPSSLGSSENLIDLVHRLRPQIPLHILYTDILAENAHAFTSQFQGTVMYAVKCNPEKEVIKTLARAGVRTFDAASLDEVRRVKKYVPDATIHFMHTVKSREAIREAYFVHGVRVFVFDTLSELHKILAATDLAPDLTLFVRLALPKNETAAVDFSAKFGATPVESVGLLREARIVAAKLGVMFHPGTQSADTTGVVRGIALAAHVIRSSGVVVDCLDVGGGFPATYPDKPVPPLTAYMDAIHQTVADEGLDGVELFCEPGRALVANAGDLVLRVELRRGDTLYLNDGVYGGLIEMIPAQGAFRYPIVPIVQHPAQHDLGGDMTVPYRLCGPTCDSYDMLPGRFDLPDSLDEGDWLVLQMTGAYSVACRTNFNGFGAYKTLLLRGPRR